MSQINSGNITQITPAAATAIAETVRTVRAIPKDRRAVPTPANSIYIFPGGYQYQVWQRTTAGSGPGGTEGALGFDWVRGHSAS